MRKFVQKFREDEMVQYTAILAVCYSAIVAFFSYAVVTIFIEK